MDIDEMMEKENELCEAIEQIESGYRTLKGMGLYDLKDAIKERQELADEIGRYWDEQDAYMKQTTESMFY